jgi:hypothetical protein
MSFRRDFDMVLRNEPRSKDGCLERLQQGLSEATDRGALTAATDDQLLAIARAALRLAEMAARRLMALSSPH